MSEFSLQNCRMILMTLWMRCWTALILESTLNNPNSNRVLGCFYF